MTLEEAIEQAERTYNENHSGWLYALKRGETKYAERCKKSMDEARQFSNWLHELVDRRKQSEKKGRTMAKYLIDIPEGREYFPEFLPTDDFYSGIYIADEHRKAWSEEFHNLSLQEMSLIEEMSELTQAISKAYRHGSEQSYNECVNPIKEEMAHVLISLAGLAWGLGIVSEDIQAEIEKKYPTAYEKEEK